jgi:hypothetical protein
MTSLLNLFTAKPGAAKPADNQSLASMSFASSVGSLEDENGVFSAEEVFSKARRMIVVVPSHPPAIVSSGKSVDSNGSSSLMSLGFNHSPEAMEGIQKLEELNAAVELNKKIRQMEKELLETYENGRIRRRRYRKIENAHLKNKNSISRSLWMKRQNHKRNPIAGMKDYKLHMFKVSLPCHDTSQPILISEAKLLKADHNCLMITHQLEMLQEQQVKIIDFFLKEVVPVARKDHHESTKVLKAKVELAVEKRDDTVKAYEDHMLAQRKLIGKFKLKEMEDDDRSVDSTELEVARLAAAETPTFEATQLRRSAELRIEAKFGSLKERQAKRLIRDEVLNNTLQNMDLIEKSSLQRAQNVSGEVESLLASIKTTVDGLASDYGESLDKDDNGKEITTESLDKDDNGKEITTESLDKDDNGKEITTESLDENGKKITTKSLDKDDNGKKITTESLDNDDNGKKITTESLDKDNGKKIATNDEIPPTPDTLELTFSEEKHHDHDEGDSDSDAGDSDSDSEHGNQNTEQKEDETAPRGNGPRSFKRSSPKSRAEVSARLEALRAKRQSSPKHPVRKNGSPRHGTAVGKQSPPGRRADVLERARSARSAGQLAKEHSDSGRSEGKEGQIEQIQEQATGTGENSVVHRRVPDARLAELRERRRNRTAAETEGGT